MAGAAAGNGRLEYRDDGKVYFIPSGADPLSIGQCEVELPAEKMDRLGFAFGGQPVIFGNEAPLPIVGINVPGGPSFNLLESMGLNIRALQGDKISNTQQRQVVPHKRDAATPVVSPKQSSPRSRYVASPPIQPEIPLAPIHDCPLHFNSAHLNEIPRAHDVRQTSGQSKCGSPRNKPSKRDRDAIPARSRKSGSRPSVKNDSPSTRYVTEKSLLSLTQLSPTRSKAKKNLSSMCGSNIPLVAGLAMDTFKSTADWIAKNLGQSEASFKTNTADTTPEGRRKLIDGSELLHKALLRRRLDRSQRRLMEDHDYYHLRHHVTNPHLQRGARSPDAYVHGVYVSPRPEDLDKQRRGRLNPGTSSKRSNDDGSVCNVVCPVSATPVTISRSKLLDHPARYTTEERKVSACSLRREISVPPRLRGSEITTSPLNSPRCSISSRKVSLATEPPPQKPPVARPGVQIPLGTNGSYQLPPLADFGALTAGATIQTFVEPIKIMHPQVGHIDENGQIRFNLGDNKNAAVVNSENLKLVQRTDGLPGAEIQMISSIIGRLNGEGINADVLRSQFMGPKDQSLRMGSTFLGGTGLSTRIGEVAVAKPPEQASDSRKKSAEESQQSFIVENSKDTAATAEEPTMSPMTDERSQLTQLALAQLAKNEESDTMSVVPGMQVVSEENGKKKMKLPDPTEKRSFRISRLDGTVREVKVISICENPCIEMVPNLLTGAECDEMIAILDGVNAAPNVPNNLLQGLDLTEIQEKALQRIVKRTCAITGLDEEELIGLCPSILQCSAVDATEDYSHLVRIYLTDKLEEHSSEFPYLGVSIRPNKGAAVRWTCKNEKGFKIARIAHQETFGETNTVGDISRTVLTAYIR